MPMRMESRVAQKVQSASPGARIELFDLDLTPVHSDAGTLYFYPGANEADLSGEVHWRGNAYVSRPIAFDGVEISTKGSMPRPVLHISNIFGVVSTLLRTYGRIEGAVLTRWITFTDYLDDGANPNPDGYLPIDVWVLDRIQKLSADAEIECRSYLDFDRKKLPARQCLRNACTHTYRQWTGSEFDYSKATCPFVGERYFTTAGVAASPSTDICGKRLSDCRKRFLNDPLPYRGFPGLGRFSS